MVRKLGRRESVNIFIFFLMVYFDFFMATDFNIILDLSAMDSFLFVAVIMQMCSLWQNIEAFSFVVFENDTKS